MRNEKIRDLVLAAMFFAIGLVLPFVTGQIPEIGKALCPMHLPVLICSLVLGWKYGAVVGLLLPITRSLIFQFPPLYPNAVAMTFELAAYGFAAGFIYGLFRKAGFTTAAKRIIALYIALIAAMIVGRLVWGAAQWVLLSLGGKAFTLEAFLAGAVTGSIPGIVIQLLLVPSLAFTLESVLSGDKSVRKAD